MGASPLAPPGQGRLARLGICSTTRGTTPRPGARLSRRAWGSGSPPAPLPQAKSHAALNNELGQPGAYTDSVERFLAGTDHGGAPAGAP